jgi:hypothetical protein
MPYYSVATPATPGDYTTSATANTLVDQMRLTTAANDAYLVRLDLVGKGQAQASITGIEADLIRYTTASTVGTTVVPNPRNPRAAAATTVAATLPTAGATLKYQWNGGMMSSGQGGFQAVDPLLQDAIYLVNGGGANGNCDIEDQTEGTVALKYHFTVLFNEV